MGLINQLKSVIQWKDSNQNELFIKYTAKGDEIKNASKLILLPGQGCILTYEGVVENILKEAGTYDITSDNKPFITSLKKMIGLQAGSEHIVGIWFFRIADILNMRWGTRVPIAYTDPVYTFPILLTAFGNYSIKITEPKYFFENIIAGQNTFCQHELKEIFLSRITQPITDYLANAKFSYVDIDSNLIEIAKNVRLKTADIFNELGFEVLDFRIEGSQFDKETLDRIAKISNVQADVLSAKIAGINYTEMQQLEAMKAAANNEGGGPGILLSMNAGTNNSPETSSAPKEKKPIDKLKELKELFEMELINQTEYAEKKKNILDSM